MHNTDFSKSTAGSLTVALPRHVSADRLDEVTNAIEMALTAEGAGRFAWHRQGRRHEEMVFHVFGEQAALLARGELDRLGYDRRALVITDPVL